MRRFLRSFLLLTNALALAVSAYSQGSCLNYQTTLVQCNDQNNCSQYVTVQQPYYPGNWCVYEISVPCCSTYLPDYSVGDYCDGSHGCDAAATRALLKRPDVLEFAFTHTLWLADCSGHVGPSAHLWEPPAKPIELRPRIRLSGIGG